MSPVKEPEKSNVIITVLGRKGMGKTYLVKEIIEEHARVVVLDTNGEYGDVVAEQYTDLDKAVDRLAALSEADKLAIEQNDPLPAFSLAYVPQLVPDDGYKFLEVAWELTEILLVVDEAAMYVQSYNLPPSISRLVRLGRHRAIDQVYVAQRAASVHRDITAQSDVVVSFGQHEGRDIVYMTGLFGDEAERLRGLPKYRVMVFGDAEKAPLCVHERIHKKAVDAQGKLF